METKKYKQLTQDQRYTIWASYSKGMTQKEIAELVGCSQSTISRELKRNRTRARGSFFADPYASWQKGSIENMNKLIRQYIPKKSDFTENNKQNIREIRNMINNRPRQKLNFKTPLFSFANHYR